MLESPGPRLAVRWHDSVYLVLFLPPLAEIVFLWELATQMHELRGFR